MELARRLIAVLAALVAAVGIAGAQPPHSAPTGPASPRVALDDADRVRKWREEVRWITTRVRELHPRPFTHCPAAAFDSAATAIEARIATTDDARLAVECMRMVALLRDGHTGLIGTFPPLGFTSVMPVALRPFEDGLYVVAADKAYESAVGAKVTRVGDVAADEALARVASATHADNAFTERDRAPLYLMLPALLHALGISRDRDAVTLELERAGGKRETVRVAGASAPDGFPQVFLATEPRYPEGWTLARRVAGDQLPRSDRRPDEAWWFAYLPESKALYVRMRRVEYISGGIGYFEFFRQLFATADTLKPRALVLDLRQNHGGSNSILDPLIRGLQARPWLNREGGLFALIDRGTFSAAMNAAVWLDEGTHARFAGEPTGGRVNHYGDARDATTPNFGMLLQVSTVPWLARVPQDGRPYLAPELATPMTFATWRDGKDLALDAAIDAAWHGTLSQRVLEAARRGGPAAGKTAYDTWTKEHPSPWSQPLMEQMAGYNWDLADRGQWQDAVLLGEAMTAIHPRSAIAWRVLGEAHMHTGNRARAIECLRKALEISPNAQMAKLLLQRLEGAPAGAGGGR